MRLPDGGIGIVPLPPFSSFQRTLPSNTPLQNHPSILWFSNGIATVYQEIVSVLFN
jgi:hypothetical protein